MSNPIALLEQNIKSIEADFHRLSSDKGILFPCEAEFAMQIIGNNSYALGIAISNPQSVRDAVTNIASIGISLNPAKKQAYLVPREGKICLDISYMGLIELALASGSILWAKAELVRAADTFQLNGFDRPPTHTFDSFGAPRGDIVGAYVVVKTRDGDYLTDTMTIAEIYDIRNRSTAWKSGKSNPWRTDEGEMVKKTVIKRAYKTWPRSDRLATAIHYLNTAGGQGIDLHTNVVDAVPAAPPINCAVELENIANAQDLVALRVIWRRCAAGCAKTKDKVSGERLSQAMIDRSAFLKSTIEVPA